MAGLTNISFYNAQRSMSTAQSGLAQTTQRLSTGLRINSSKDDAAGLAIAERMNAQNRGMAVAVRNANDAISMVQTAEGAFGNVADALQRMRELAVQARNATNTDSDKDALDKEFGQLAEEVQRIFTGTSFNGKAVVGADAGAQTYQIGAGTAGADSITITTKDMTAEADITAVAGTDLAGAGQYRQSPCLGQYRTGRLRRGAKPVRLRRQESVELHGSQRRLARPHHGCRFCDRNRQPSQVPNLAASQRSHARTIQPARRLDFETPGVIRIRYVE